MNRETTLCPGSSNIAEFTYDGELGMLEVGFVSGDFYTYTGVPAQVALQFQRAGSRGEFFRRHIRNRYPYDEGRLPPVADGGA